MRRLAEIEGVSTVYAQKLSDAGYGTPQAFLNRCATRKGRKEVAAETGISDTLILKWANRVDLARINGIGEQYSDLLEASGVDTVPELAQRNAANLYQKMLEVNGFERRVRKLPTEAQVAGWIKDAGALPRVMEY
jgi:predicted flap endonuclease-1-like 5' DNA nuclease